VVAVGRLFRARGIRGELTAEIYSPQPGRAEKLKDVVLEKADGKTRTARVEEVWWHGGRPVFKFEGIDSISEAEQWEGAELLVPASEVESPEEGAYSYAELVGCRVVGDRELGVVMEVEEYGGAPLLKVEGADGREVLIPFARSICTEIDVASKTIRVELPEGLLEQQ